MAYNWIQRLRVGQSERKDFYGVLASMTSSKSRIQIRNALSEMRDSLLKYKQPLGPFVDEALRRMAGHDKSREGAVGRLGGALKGMVPASEAALIIEWPALAQAAAHMENLLRAEEGWGNPVYVHTLQALVQYWRAVSEETPLDMLAMVAPPPMTQQ